MPEINWYPGHMARAKRLLTEQLRRVDAVVELCDARAPLATRNPDLDKLCAGKARVLVLNKADLANDAMTKRWLDYFKKQGITAVRFVASGGPTGQIKAAIDDAVRPGIERMKAKGVNKTARLMIVGIPNVGKSSFINRLYGSAIAKASDRPGVTRSNQWVKVGPFLELLDTPGLLWPKLSDQHSARLLALIGSIRDQIMDGEELAGTLLQMLLTIDEQSARARYKLGADVTAETEPLLLVEAACKGRGWLLGGGRFDTDRGAAVILDEFRAGKVGKITLERPAAEV